MTNRRVATVIDSASALLDAGQAQHALRLIAPQIASHPDDSHALRIAADAHLQLENHDEAARLARAALRLRPEDQRAWFVLAFAELRRGENAKAVDAVDRCRALAPQLWMSHTNSAIIYGDTGTQLPIAVEFAREGVRLAPNESAAHLVLGRVLVYLKRWEQAETAFLEALRLNPDNADARQGLSHLQLERGRLGSAVAGFADVLRSDPTRDTAVHNLKVAGLRMVRSIVQVVWPVYFLTANLIRPHGLLDRGGVDPALGWLALGLAPVLIGAIAGWRIRRVALGAGDGLRRIVVASMRLERGLAVMFALLAVSFAASVIAIPFGPLRGYGVYLVGFVTLLIASAILWQRNRALRWQG